MSQILLCCWPQFGYECIGYCENMRAEPGRNEFVSMSCLSRWHRCQKVLGSHPSPDKWLLGLLRMLHHSKLWCRQSPKDSRWRLKGLSGSFASSWMVDICWRKCFWVDRSKHLHSLGNVWFICGSSNKKVSRDSMRAEIGTGLFYPWPDLLLKMS